MKQDLQENLVDGIHLFLTQKASAPAADYKAPVTSLLLYHHKHVSEHSINLYVYYTYIHSFLYADQSI